MVKVRYSFVDLAWLIAFVMFIVAYFIYDDLVADYFFILMSFLALATMYVVGLLKHCIYEIQGRNDDKEVGGKGGDK